MSEEKSPIIPALLAGAAIYFGLSGRPEAVGDITKEAIRRVIDSETAGSVKHKPRLHVKAHKKPKQLKNTPKAKVIVK